MMDIPFGSRSFQFYNSLMNSVLLGNSRLTVILLVARYLHH